MTLLLLALLAQDVRMTFERHSVKDPAVNNIDGATLLIPEGWKVEGGFVWMPNFSMGANLLLRISDPASGASVEALPSQQFNWPAQPMPGAQVGNNWMGSMLCPPPGSFVEFVNTILVPGQLAHLRGQQPTKVDDLPKYAAELARTIPAGNTVRCARLRYAYTINEKAYDEELLITLTFAAENGWTKMWWCSGTAMRAPAGKLDPLKSVLNVPFQSVRLSPDWFAMLNHVRDLIRRGFAQELADQRRLGQMWAEHREEMRQKSQKAFEERMAQQDRQNFAFRENIGGIETYKNPFEARAVELPAGWKDYWVDPEGRVILSNDQTWNPAGDFKKMERHSP